MAVAYVATGSVVNGKSTTRAITSPAGSINDLLIFMLVHDDWSRGPMDDAPTGGVTLTSISDGDPQLGDDTRTQLWWGKEDQTAGRAYTFGTLSVGADENSGVCIRYSGQHLTTPIQAGSLIRGGGPNLRGGLSGNVFGGMFVGAMGSDTQWVMDPAPTAPTGTNWSVRVANVGNRFARMSYFDRPVDTYPIPQVLEDLHLDGDTTRYGQSHSSMFVIAPAETSRTIEGITKDNAGSVLGSVVVSLFKDKGSGVFEYCDTTTSHSGTGAYSFTVLNDDESLFWVYGRKDDSPHVFDCSDPVLAPS